MNAYKLLFPVILTALISCSEKANESVDNYSLIEIKEDNTTPTVDLAAYSLVKDSQADRSADAREILSVKRKWPLAMQSLEPQEFEAILSKNFTFTSGTTFLNRADYIKNRTTPDDWRITFVTYDHVTLQFFETMAVLSYRNHVRNENSVTHEVELEHMSWVDIFVKENNDWKIAASHSIDYRLEVIADSLNAK